MTSTSPLPPNWEEVATDDGNVYYWNQVTNATTWERPVFQPIMNDFSSKNGPVIRTVPTSYIDRKEQEETKKLNQVKHFIYREGNVPIAIRSTEAVDSPRTGEGVTQGDIIDVVHTKYINGNLMLQLADGRGWVPQRHPQTNEILLEEITGTNNLKHPTKSRAHSNLSPTRSLDQMANRFITQSYTLSMASGIQRCEQLQILTDGQLVAHGRYLIREGPLTKINRGGPKKYQFFLLNDAIAYAAVALTGSKYTLNREIPLSSVMIKPGPTNNQFEFYSSSKSFIIQAKDNESRDSWMNDLQRIINETKSPNDSTQYAPIWQPGTNCSICGLTFGLLHRRHHCRKCGRIVCQPCSFNKANLPEIDAKKLVRVCTQCYAEISNSRTYGVNS